MFFYEREMSLKMLVRGKRVSEKSIDCPGKEAEAEAVS